MAGARLVLTGHSAGILGLQWETTSQIRIGRQADLDISLNDPTISPLHAEISCIAGQWLVRELPACQPGHSFLNHTPLTRQAVRIGKGDVLTIGSARLVVADAHVGGGSSLAPTSTPAGPKVFKTSGSYVRVQEAAAHTWEQALQTAVGDVTQGTPQQHLLTLLRTGHHLCHISSLDELLHSVLREVMHALGAQRGAIVLADGTGTLHLRALLEPGLQQAGSHLGFSRTLVTRCYETGESLLCQDVRSEAAFDGVRSLKNGDMSSIICAVLRSPRQRLGVLHLDRGPLQEPFTSQDFYLADAVAASVAVGIESAQLVASQRDEFIQAVTSLARVVELRDQYTGDHTRRVTDYSLLLADELRIAPLTRYRIQIGTPLHDIGKIGIDDAILRKPGKLTPAEFAEMKLHTVKGATILSSIQNLQPMIPIVRHHHERWDGMGYPDHLAGEKISAEARIVAVADAFDAMTSNRPYRPAMPAAHAFREIETGAGRHFDPTCAAAFLRLRPKIEAMMVG